MVHDSLTEKRDRKFANGTLPDFLALGLGLALAYGLQWETKDLVWSLWLCSLTIGFLTLFSGMLGAWRKPDRIREGNSSIELPKSVLIGSSLFSIVFFSVHFGAFHAGHSVFLQQFFPLNDVPEDGFGKAFMNPLLLWGYAFKYLLPAYGLFLIPALITEREQLRVAYSKAQATTKAQGLGGVMIRPYINVVRMHLLIFFFAFAQGVNADSFVVYAVVYFVYFFPWRLFKKNKEDLSDGVVD